ncbi:response regulator transcription factor (plasmid) [Paraburkholderia sprentiae WSM5005]|uniref:Response regulator transcription factor n=1 Tax=Paraburkholderia sprentiae WSM5005 TaxID=754502 RepID=A0A1I9YUZ3_9BURK|nr:response regulator transcription factor [Paraburkholderia sprentiae]APA90007.1 response regulator transcription factor [Paraburkholderia sprentiae WSM5005]
MKKIRVGIADDHPFILLGVEHLLRPCPDMQVCFKCESIGRLLELLVEMPVDVLVCDYEFEGDPYADGLNLLDRIQRVAPAIRVVFLSSHSSTHIISAALNAGAAGFVGKGPEGFVSLAAAIRAAKNKSLFLPDSIANRMLSTTGRAAEGGSSLNSLSEKESTVVRMICDGMSIGAIAERLNRSPKTVSNQKNAGMKKLGARNDVELVTIVREWYCS